MIDKVISGDFCIGCGACTATAASPFRIRANAHGSYEAFVPAEVAVDAAAVSRADRVCPFSDAADNEDQIAAVALAESTQHTPEIGRYLECYAGHVTESDFRERGSSGGLGSWIVAELLARGMADHVIHVGGTAAGADGAPLFEYAISSTAAEIRAGAKSKYYPIELSGVLEQVRRVPGRYVLVGIPCFLKAARLLAAVEPVFAERIVWHVGLVCGHLKSRRFAELLAWQMGIEPTDVRDVDFRVKLPGRPASQYGVSATGTSKGEETTRTAPTRELYGTNWGHGMFKCKACDFCDDVLAETADVVVGDAWLPRFAADFRGTNILVTRRAAIDKLVRDAREQGRLALEIIPPADVARSQDAGLRHRRDALPYRLQRHAGWVPRKRKFPGLAPLDRRERQKQDLRTRIRTASHEAFAAARQSNRLALFLSQLQPLTLRLERLSDRTPAWRRWLRRLRNALRRG